MDLSKLKGKKFYGKARTQFLAHRDSIAAAIEQGYPLSVIWESMHSDGIFDAKYIQFVRYVSSLLPDKDQRKKPEGTPKIQSAIRYSPQPPASQHSNGMQTPAEKPKGGFNVDPDRPKRASVEMPKPFVWNPLPMTDEEIRNGRKSSQ